jgi:DNA replication protein DnaC
MERQKNQQEDSTEIDNIEIISIGVNKYSHLKSKIQEKLTETEKKQIEAYEKKNVGQTPEQLENELKYFEKLLKPKQKMKFSISALQLYRLFKRNFPLINNRPFIKVKNVTIKNLEPLIYYFSKDERFFTCENLSRLSEPSFDKGILIIGNFGNGKTSTMKVFEKIFKGIPNLGFKTFSANEAVTMFEKCTGDEADILRKEFEKLMWHGTRCFDDLKTERIASNYGKVNIFKEILEERYRLGSKTFLICNYKEGCENDLQAAIDELGEKYGGRVWDRVYEMFNIIEFKGKSFRK